MREQLNNNPVVQMAVVAVLLLAGGFFFISTMGGGEEEAAGGGAAATASPEAGAPAGTPVEPLGAEAGAAVPAEAATVPQVEAPASVVEAWESGATVVLLIVRDGGIDDRLVRDTTASLASLPGTVIFVVPAAQIADYAAVTGGVGVERVPALVVMSPKEANGDVATASVRYGFQSRQAAVQAVIDAGYEGPTLDYHP